MELCDGIEQDSYSVLLRCLSDVEWLLFLRTQTHPEDTSSEMSMSGDDDDDIAGSMSAQYRPVAGHYRPAAGSLLDELFAFQLVTGRLCDCCHQLSVNIAPSYVLTLPLAQTSTIHECHLSIDSCLRQFTGTEYQPAGCEPVVPCVRCDRDELVVQCGCVVGGRDILGCMDVGSRHIYRPRTGGHVTRGGRGYQTRSLLSKCPPYLIIHLLRHGDNSPVSVARRLSLGKGVVIGDHDVTQYQLRAVCCCHVVSQGRYVTYTSCDDVTWYKFDDVTVTRVNIDAELISERIQQNVFLLTYRRLVTS